MTNKSWQGDFASITISFFAHSTENAAFLVELVSTCLGVPIESIETKSVEGHYGNAMTFARSHISGEGANLISRAIFERLDPSSKEVLASEIDKNIDEHDSFFLRVDRQTLNAGKLLLGEDEPIRIKMKPKHRQGGHNLMIESYKELLRS